VALKAGVNCKSCGERIEVQDEYIPGISGSEAAAGLYQPIVGRSVDLVNRSWHTALICDNPDCRRTHEYTASDLILYSD